MLFFTIFSHHKTEKSYYTYLGGFAWFPHTRSDMCEETKAIRTRKCLLELGMQKLSSPVWRRQLTEMKGNKKCSAKLYFPRWEEHYKFISLIPSCLPLSHSHKPLWVYSIKIPMALKTLLTISTELSVHPPL